MLKPTTYLEGTTQSQSLNPLSVWPQPLQPSETCTIPGRNGGLWMSSWLCGQRWSHLLRLLPPPTLRVVHMETQKTTWPFLLLEGEMQPLAYQPQGLCDHKDWLGKWQNVIVREREGSWNADVYKHNNLSFCTFQGLLKIIIKYTSTSKNALSWFKNIKVFSIYHLKLLI